MPVTDTPYNPSFDEAGRLVALHALALLDSEPEKEFDALVGLAAEMLGCPTALLSLVDRDRLWIKASNAPGEREVKRDIAFCDHTIRNDDALIVDDLATDPRFHDNPLVVDAGMRFYAGTPIHAVDKGGVRQPIGALCVIDTTPRSLSPAGRSALAHLGQLADAMIAARQTALRAIEVANDCGALATELARKDRVFRQAERIAMVGSWRLSLADDVLDWSDQVFRIHGLPIGEKPALSHALDFYPPESRALVSERLARTIESGEPFDFETDFITANGDRRRVRTMGEVERDDGAIVALIGVFQDVTDRHALETQLRQSADTDSLTGIANRAAFDRTLVTAMATARRHDTPLLLALIDLDGFKAINDTLGHGAGDDVLCLTGAALSQPWLRGCHAARIGGDEFALIVDDPALIADREGLRMRIEDVLRIPVEANGMTMTSAGTVGIAAFDAECRSVRDFARRADTILYAAKRARIGERRRAA